MKGLHAARLLEEKCGPGVEPVLACAPGRVNLIGEHTDYNEGYVLPFAIDRFTEIAIRPRSDRKVIVYTAAFDDILCIELPLHPSPRRTWQDYILGVLWEFTKLFEIERGFEAVIWSNIPLGAGLSSSAALEVAFALGLSRLYAIEIGDLDLVKLCQRAERDFVGMPCGIMDQYTAFFAKAGTALLLDARDLRHRYIPLDLTDVAILIVDSNVRRTL
ncbi:MAG: galactokinase, partial [Deltaproteobacteria bacterium]|nr:galactokinase [Deltaproteobacteria bacterium]